MRHRRSIATGVIAAAGLALVGSAQAAPDIQGVEVTKISSNKVEVLVETLRGTAAVRPRIRVTVARRSARAKVQDWDPSLAADDIVESVAKVSRVRSRVGSTVSVRVRACDTDCTTITRDVTVAADDTTVDEVVEGQVRHVAFRIVGRVHGAVEMRTDMQRRVDALRNDPHGL